MVKVGIFCFAGMSTSVLVKRMQEFAKEKNLDCEIDAYPQSEVADRAPGLDVVLLGPQIKYYQKRIEDICKPSGVPVMVVSNVDFGRMDGKKVLTEAYGLLGKTI
ncbi:MAG: PTS sugar transporter subunit IIB [Clostridium sp.]|nr:PTS sugar transporter subunit IIB [Clostridium sp.]